MSALRVLLVGNPWQRGALSAVRSLAASGHLPCVAATEPGHAGRSRHRAGFWRLPACQDPAFGDAFRAVVRDSEADVVMATDDEHLAVLSSRPELAGPATLGHPTAAVIATVLDKSRLREVAAAAGMSVPRESNAAPSQHPDRWIAKRRTYSTGDAHVHRLVSDFGEHEPPDDGGWIFQEVLEGPLAAVVLVADKTGQLRYCGAQLAERLHPRPFGVSTRATTFILPEWWRTQVADLVGVLGWWGIAELQFVCPPGREPHLIDFNGRPFGSLALTGARGVDLVGATVALALGESMPDLAAGSAAQHYQWLEGDLRQALSGPAPIREVLDALRAAPHSVHSIWDRQDPWPATRHGASLAGRVARRLPAVAHRVSVVARARGARHAASGPAS